MKKPILTKIRNMTKMAIWRKIAKGLTKILEKWRFWRKWFKEKSYEMPRGAPWKNHNELSKFSNILKCKICQHWEDNLNDLANRSLRRLVKVLAKIPIRWINFIFNFIFIIITIRSDRLGLWLVCAFTVFYIQLPGGKVFRILSDIFA